MLIHVYMCIIKSFDFINHSIRPDSLVDTTNDPETYFINIESMNNMLYKYEKIYSTVPQHKPIISDMSSMPNWV